MPAQNQQHTHATDGTAKKSTPESIDQVRDLLFGAQMRTFDSQIQTLTDRMMKENAALRSDFDRRVAELQQTLERTAADLQSKKLDAAALSAGLNELAKKLGERR